MMEWLGASVYLAGGLVLLLVGGDVLVRAAADLAFRFKISPSVIGLTLVAGGTSAPELLTSLTAAFDGVPDLAMGNIIGSNIFNLLLVLGISACVFPIHLLGSSSTKTSQPKSYLHIEYFTLVGLSCLFVALLYNHFLSQLEGGILVALLLALAYGVFKKGPPTEAPAQLGRVHPLVQTLFKALGGSRFRHQFAVQNASMLILGCVGLIAGARLAITGGLEVGELVGLSERQIGLFIVSVGTSLPEIATSLMAARQKQNEIAVANVVGSNVLNMLAVGGLTALLHPLQIEPSLLQIDALFMLGMTFMIGPLVLLHRYRITRFAGVVLLSFYVLYLWMALQ